MSECLNNPVPPLTKELEVDLKGAKASIQSVRNRLGKYEFADLDASHSHQGYRKAHRGYLK
jgi:hypothetical protein